MNAAEQEERYESLRRELVAEQQKHQAVRGELDEVLAAFSKVDANKKVCSSRFDD